MRVFRCSQRNGTETLEPASGVVVSPPITKIAPGLDYVVRVVRLSKRPAVREESYRVLVDELPDPARPAGRTVSFLVRYSIPVFFSPPRPEPAALDWRVARGKGKLVLTATNPGGRRAKITGLALRDARGRTATLEQGLAGYVLAGARNTWRFDWRRVGGLAPGPARLIVQTDREAADVPVVLPAGG